MLWDPAFFGVRPHVVLKGGMIAWAQMGDANASIPTPQPVLPRPMFGALRRGARRRPRCTSSPRRRSRPGWPTGSAVDRRLVAVGDTTPADARRTCRRTTRCRDIQVDPDTFTVSVDGEVFEPEPVARAAHGPALLPVLMDLSRAAHAGRLPAARRRARALRRAWSRRSPPGVRHRPRVAGGVPARPAGDLRGGRRRAGRRRVPAVGDADALAGRLDAEADARTPSPALRTASRGSRAAGWSGSAAAPGRTPAWDALPPLQPHHPIALGVAAAAGGLDAPGRARGGRLLVDHRAGHAPPSGCSRMDPLTVAAVTARLAARGRRGRRQRPSDGLPAAADPLLDLLAELHAARKDRLFAS